MGSHISIFNFFEIFPFKKPVGFNILLREVYFAPSGAAFSKGKFPFQNFISVLFSHFIKSQYLWGTWAFFTDTTLFFLTQDFPFLTIKQWFFMFVTHSCSVLQKDIYKFYCPVSFRTTLTNNFCFIFRISPSCWLLFSCTDLTWFTVIQI